MVPAEDDIVNYESTNGVVRTPVLEKVEITPTTSSPVSVVEDRKQISIDGFKQGGGSRHGEGSNSLMRMNSHNWAAQMGLGVIYADTVSGPTNAPTWVSKVHVDGQQYGLGTGAKKADAREHAASQALDQLCRTNGP
ncbi:hypothetical protein BDP27DRAFT_287665 [Rhodocollybia butyracea]|uniref:DRBM domain-containing protein n=1 Tax=Rhodocollybia butyracea TaxID=206335 RepID=A0A9P5UC14_9AGAR|nr:hypothetical protein BDP27DRAFT_287665 [Rhodocollybia butyracea]